MLTVNNYIDKCIILNEYYGVKTISSRSWYC